MEQEPRLAGLAVERILEGDGIRNDTQLWLLWNSGMATADEKCENAVGFEYIHKTENFVYKAKGSGVSD